MGSNRRRAYKKASARVYSHLEVAGDCDELVATFSEMDFFKRILKLILLLSAVAVAEKSPRQATKTPKVYLVRSGNDPNAQNPSPRQDLTDPTTTDSSEHVWGGPVPVPTFPPSHYAPAPIYYTDSAPAPAPSYHSDPAPAPATYYVEPAPAPAPHYPDPTPAPAPYYPDATPAPAPHYPDPAPAPSYSYHSVPAPAPYPYHPAPAPAPYYPDHTPAPAPYYHPTETTSGYYYYYYPVKDVKGGKFKGYLTHEEKSWLAVLVPVAIIAVGVPILAVILSAVRSFVNDDADDKSGVARMLSVYTKVLDSEECVQRICCELGSTASGMPAKSYIFPVIDVFVPSTMKNNMEILKMSALRGRELSHCESFKCSWLKTQQ